MIAFFPSPYEDELLYSWLARYYVRSGYMKYIFVADDLFQNRHEVPKVEFINTLTEDAVQNMQKYLSMEEMILWHTMFPYYARFLTKERKKEAFQSLLSMDGAYAKILPMPNCRSSNRRLLKYCPMCAAVDRKQHGEAYWHRTHQLIGITVCPIHGCCLIATDISTKSAVSPTFHAAEDCIPQDFCVEPPKSPIDTEVAQYLWGVFTADFSFSANMKIAAYFNDCLIGTPYLSARGEQRNMSVLLSDFNSYYSALSQPYAMEWAQMQKLLQGKRLNPYEICLLGNFLHISPSELSIMQVSSINHIKQYDKAIKSLHQKGWNYAQIAKKLGGSYDYVKAIGEGKRGSS